MSDVETVYPVETVMVEVYEDGQPFLITYFGDNGPERFEFQNPEDALTELRRILDRRVTDVPVVNDQRGPTLEDRVSAIERRLDRLEAQIGWPKPQLPNSGELLFKDGGYVFDYESQTYRNDE